MATGIAELVGVRAKLRRAEEHNGTFKTEFGIWAKHQSHGCVFHIRRDDVWHIVLVDPPKQALDIHLSVILGDLVYNLRSALDHLVWQLVLRDGNEPSDANQFPICDTREGFTKEIDKRKRLQGITVEGDAWAIVKAAQPYNCVPPESSVLRTIRQLSNMDKHRTVPYYLAFPRDVRNIISWNPDAILFEEKCSGLPLSLEEPTEIIRLRFAKYPNPNVNVKGALTIDPTLGQGPGGGYQVPFAEFPTLIEAVTQIVDEVSRLPRVIDPFGHQNPPSTSKG